LGFNENWNIKLHGQIATKKNLEKDWENMFFIMEVATNYERKKSLQS
jgi:hypothetical protein